jgi:LacI family transcriptional regulator, galactose operon repressor
MPARRPRNVNLIQLATHTGLSVATVSSVMNGLWKERRISAESVQRVRAAALELGYVPNIFARQLSMQAPGTSQAMLAVITSFAAPLTLVSHAALALHRAVRELDASNTRFTITIEMFEAGALDRLPGLLDHHRFSGAIIANTFEADDRFLETAQIPFPIVLINRRLPNFAAVVASPETGRIAAQMLLEAGRTHCALLTPALGTSSTTGRAAEFQAAVRTATGRSAVRITCAGRTEEDGYRAMRAHLKRHRETDGIFAANDMLAVGAYRAIYESGRTIPDDIHLIGVGDHSASPYLTPPLTCVGSSEELLHTEAAALLLALFTGHETGKPHRVLPAQIERRASTGA